MEKSCKNAVRLKFEEESTDTTNAVFSKYNQSFLTKLPKLKIIMANLETCSIFSSLQI